MSDQKQSSLFNCTNICWMIAVVLGFAAFKVALSRMDYGPLMSMIVGIAFFFLFGWLLSKFLCSNTSDEVETADAPKAPEKPVTPKASTATAPKNVVKSEPKNTPLAEEAAPVEKAAKKKAPVKKAASKVVEPADDVAVEEKKPRTLKAPRKAGADDLKLLKGVGPKLENTLNELGFFHFNQVSKWGAAEIAWVDARLKFKGRIERDGWIDQAKILADGGETEFSKRSKKA